jgi:hypothetical protein
MRVRSAGLVGILFMAGLLAGGCASSTAPNGWLPSAIDAGTRVRGGWATVSTGRDERRPAAEGELIAVEPDTLFVLSGGTLVGVPRAAILRATVTGYYNDWKDMRAWTALGSISTFSHGGFLILSLPAWILVGSIATAGASREPQMVYPETKWEKLPHYARFPQGLPAALDRRRLESK